MKIYLFLIQPSTMDTTWIFWLIFENTWSLHIQIIHKNTFQCYHLMLIFLLQSVWLYIWVSWERFGTWGTRFLLNISPRLVVIVLPLTILLSYHGFWKSVRKSGLLQWASGISLQRSMRVLIVFTIFLGFLTFLFSNYIIPISEYNFRNLRKILQKLNPPWQ